MPNVQEYSVETGCNIHNVNIVGNGVVGVFLVQSLEKYHIDTLSNTLDS